MSLFSDGAQFINDFISKESKDLNQTIFGATNRATTSAGGQLQKSAVARVQSPTLDSLSSNPIVNMGVDTLNQAVTTVSQQLLVTGSKQVEATVNKLVGIPIRKTIQDVTDGYYTLMALASTATIEIAMELARTNARTIVSLVAQKEALITTMHQQITSIYNAIVILLNSSPFFTAYYQKLVVAYNEINQANIQLKRVSLNLQTAHHYNSILYDQALAKLNDAETLILPDRSAQINDISQLGTFLTNTITRKSSADALAAAMSIPGLSYNFGQTYLQYVAITVEINVLITLFLTALNAFISSFKRNDNIDANTINHIKAGTNQLDQLLSDMKVVLFPTNFSSSLLAVPKFQSAVTTNATGWGIRLATTIQWLTIQPGKASAILDITGESVARYKKAVAALKAQGNITVGLATLTIVESQENVKDTTVAMGKLLFAANTVVGTQQPPLNAKANVIKMTNLLDAAHILDQNIVSALTPFINTPFELLAGAQGIVKQMLKVSKDLGLDRATDLLKKADLGGFFAMNGSTATYAGAAVAGVTAIITGLTQNPNTTQAQMSSMEQVRTNFDRKNQAKQVEANRGVSNSTPTFVATQQQNFAREQQQANQAIETAKAQDATITQDAKVVAQNTVTKAIGNRFNFGGFA